MGVVCLSKGWRQVAFGGLQMWHHHDREVRGAGVPRGCGGLWWACAREWEGRGLRTKGGGSRASS